MKNPSKNNRTLAEDLAKVYIIFKVPELAELLVNAIPGLTYDRYIKDYRAIWNLALPATALTILRKYAGSELERTFAVQMAARISTAINNRAKKSEIMKNSPTDETPVLQTSGNLEPFISKLVKVSECLIFLNQKDFKLFTTRLNSLTLKERNGLLNMAVPDDEIIKKMTSIALEEWKHSPLLKKGVTELYHREPERMTRAYFLKGMLELSQKQLKFMASVCLKFN